MRTDVRLEQLMPLHCKSFMAQAGLCKFKQETEKSDRAEKP